MSSTIASRYLISGSLIYFDSAPKLAELTNDPAQDVLAYLEKPTLAGRRFSGHGGNIAYNAALLGDASAVLLVGRVGGDFKEYAMHLTKSGVSLDYLEGATGPTAHSWNTLDATGRVCRVFQKGVMPRAVRAPEQAFTETCAFWYLGPEHAENTSLLASQAIGQNKKYFLDPGFSLTAFLTKEYDFACSFEDMLKNTSGLFLTEEESALLQSTLGLSLDSLWNLCPKLEFMVETIGESGLNLITKEKTQHIARFTEIEHAPEASGSGRVDALKAGFLSGYLKNWDLVKCASLGAALASFVQEEQHHAPSMQEVYSKAFPSC